MMYGCKAHWDELFGHAQRLAEEKKVKLVYGATMGSISRGLAAVDSDYDSRFLFVRDDLENNWLDPSDCKEKDIIFRYFRDDGHRTDIDIKFSYDRIAFWELTSFLRLLKKPAIGKETFNVDGLYYVAEHTFMSPYTYDPYGIQQRILPYIHKYPKSNFVVNHCMKMIKKIEGKDRLLAKDYIDAVWAALSIIWIQKNGGPSPVDFSVLLSALDDEKTKKSLEKWAFDLIAVCNDQFETNNIGYRGYSRYHVYCDEFPDANIVINNGIKASGQNGIIKYDNDKEEMMLNSCISSIVRGIAHPIYVKGISEE